MLNEKQQIIYDMLNMELDTLKDDNSIFIFNAKGQRLLIDKSCYRKANFRVRIRGGYAETEYRLYVDGRMMWKSVGRSILGLTDPKLTTDHINQNTLDNRLCNLRPLTLSENLKNKRKASLTL